MEGNTEEESQKDKEEEFEPPSSGSLKAALIGSFKSAHTESNTRSVRAIVLVQTNAFIASHVANNSVEFAKKEAASKRLMASKRRAVRELEEKVMADAAYLAWQAY
jgi:hypothetical protein